jgi:Tfp pilus assembly protein PilX
MFILTLVTLMVVNVLDTTTLELSTLRNSMDYERAMYLANAGVHHIAATLETNSTWRGTVTDGSFPADDSYFAEAVDGPDSTVIVTSSGVAGDVVRNLQATIEL